MNCFTYSADIYCEDCGAMIRDKLDNHGLTPDDPDDFSSYDSDDYPKGPDDAYGTCVLKQHDPSAPSCNGTGKI